MAAFAAHLVRMHLPSEMAVPRGSGRTRRRHLGRLYRRCSMCRLDGCLFRYVASYTCEGGCDSAVLLVMGAIPRDSTPPPSPSPAFCATLSCDVVGLCRTTSMGVMQGVPPYLTLSCFFLCLLLTTCRRDRAVRGWVCGQPQVLLRTAHPRLRRPSISPRRLDLVVLVVPTPPTRVRARRPPLRPAGCRFC